MRGLLAPVVAVLGMLAVVGCSSAPRAHDNPDYVSLASIGAQHGMRYSVESPGRGVIEGGGNRVVAQDRLTSAIVNGGLVPLGGPVVFDGDDAKVPRDSVERITSALAQARVEPQLPTVHTPPTTPVPHAGRALTIVIDAGHGGKFDGCKSRTGVREKDVTLDVAKRLRDDLTRMGYRVIMTRESDRALSSEYRDDLDSRVRLAERNGADLFISIHANWMKDSGITGFEVYKPRDEDRRAKELRLASSLRTSHSGAKNASMLYDLNRNGSAALAADVRDAMRTTGIPDRGIRDAGFHVIKWAPCPAVLVETDYLSNAGGSSRLGNASYRQRIADALAGAVTRFAAGTNHVGMR